MSKEQSLLLDFMRFVASMLVLIHHAEQVLDVDYLSPFASFGHDAVVFFFILSGFVIAYVCKYKEKSLMEYSIARFVRMYSVVIPSILLVLILFLLGSLFFNHFYENKYSDVMWIPIVLKSLFFLNQSALTSAAIPTNGPFWSISYEVWYYIIFGAFFFLHGISKWIIAFGLVLVAGLKIIILFPIWISGYFLYQKSQKFKQKKVKGIVIVLFSVIVYFLIRATNFDDFLYHTSVKFLFVDESIANHTLAYSKRFLPDYLTTILFLLLLSGLFMLSDLYHGILLKFEKAIRTSASYSFSIYLFHYPLLVFFGQMFDNGLLVICISLIVIILLGGYSEKKKGALKVMVINLVNRKKT